MRKIIMVLIMLNFLIQPLVEPFTATAAKKVPSDWAGWNEFLIAGQSNAVGVAPVVAQNTFDDIVVFGVDYRYHVAQEPCASQGDTFGVVDFVSYNEGALYGPTKRFAIEMRFSRPGMKIGMINVAKGGTSIAAWQKTNGFDDATLYGAMVKRAGAARLGPILGFIWIQGEGDTIAQNAETAAIYDALLIQLIDDLRTDLNLPNLPVVIAGLGKNAYADTSYYPNWNMVDGKLYAASLAIPNSVYVPMSDVPLTIGYDQYHRVHYNVPGYNTLAARLAGAMDGLMEP